MILYVVMSLMGSIQKIICHHFYKCENLLWLIFKKIYFKCNPNVVGTAVHIYNLCEGEGGASPNSMHDSCTLFFCLHDKSYLVFFACRWNNQDLATSQPLIISDTIHDIPFKLHSIVLGLIFCRNYLTKTFKFVFFD